MVYFILALIALTVGWYFAQRADARVSEEGFAKGYQEGDELVTKFYGDKPTLNHLYEFNAIQYGVFQAPAVIMLACGIPLAYVMGWFLAMPIAAAGRHLLAVRKWRRAFASHGESLEQGYKWWQKLFFGD